VLDKYISLKMSITHYEQQQLVYCWLREANLAAEFPLVYAGHELNSDAFLIRFFLLKPVNGLSQYGTIRISSDQVKRDFVRFRIGQID
jgi:hypothetical protein